jgi:5-methylcytosine-specific restriction protein A
VITGSPVPALPSWLSAPRRRRDRRIGDDTDARVQVLTEEPPRVYHSEWIVRIRDGLPEFVPPGWIDPERRPRRKPLPHLVAS